jgi:hypothetical protein
MPNQLVSLRRRPVASRAATDLEEKTAAERKGNQSEQRVTRLVDRVSPEWRRALSYGGLVWLFSRMSLTIVTYFGVLLADRSAVAGPAQLLAAWRHWDANWYLSVATSGYSSGQSTAFFPLYPLLIHGLNMLLPWISPFASGVIVSNVALFIAVVLLVRLTEREFGINAARSATVLFVAYPAAFFLSTAYAESVFMAFVLASFLCLRGGQWLWAGLFAALATATRPTGGMLVFAFAWEFVRQSPVTWSGLRGRALRLTAWRGHGRDLRTLLLRLLATGGMFVAVGVYCAFLWSRFGDPLIFKRAEGAYWQHVRALPVKGLWLGVRALVAETADTYLGARGLLDLVPIVAFLCILVAGIRRLPVAYTLFGIAVITLSLTAPIPGDEPLQSGFRYMLAAFPVFMLLGVWCERWPWLQTGLLYAWLPLQGILVVLFLHNGWII